MSGTCGDKLGAGAGFSAAARPPAHADSSLAVAVAQRSSMTQRHELVRHAAHSDTLKAVEAVLAATGLGCLRPVPRPH